MPHLSKQVQERQLTAAHQAVEKALIGQVVAGVITMGLFFQAWGRLLVPWSLLIIVLAGIQIASSRLRHKLPALLPIKAAKRFLTVLSVLLAATLSSVPFWLAAQTDGFTSAYMLSLALGTFWCGSFVLAPVFASASGYMLTHLVTWTGCAFAVGMDWEHVSLTALFGCGVGIGLYVVHQYSGVFARDFRQQLELELKTGQLQKQTELIELLLKEHEAQSSDWLWQTDENGCIKQPTERFVEALAQVEQSLDGRKLLSLLSRPDRSGNVEALAELAAQIDARASFRDLLVPSDLRGEPVWWLMSGRPFTDATGAFAGFRGVMADVTAAKLAEAKIVHLALHDTLTDLPNRSYFCQTLERTLRTRGDDRIAVLSIDLDGFKPVNDRFGHPTGDELLSNVATRLRQSVGDSDVVARFGGDEFAIFTRRCAPAQVEALCRQLLRVLEQPVATRAACVTVGASIGVAFAPDDGDTTDVLISNADAALYRAKKEGRGTFRFFAPEMDQKLQERQQLIGDLRTAIARGELQLYYQPFVGAESGAVTGCEALLRWNHPERGLVSPAEFIPVAEDSGLIVPIGAWVMEEACRQAAGWTDGQRVSVNISPVQFRDRDLPERILETLIRTGLAPHRLEVELTETVLVADADTALDILRRIRALGVRIVLDDFGTGYSSLAYLRQFPFDKIKIDRSFVRDLDVRHDSNVIVQAIRDIAIGLGMTITAEGVETAEQAAQLQRTGCHELQGFMYSRPVAKQDLEALLGTRYAMTRSETLPDAKSA